MQKRIYAFCTGSKYGKEQPLAQAKSLEPFGYYLCVITDQKPEYFAAAPNLIVKPLEKHIPSDLPFKPDGWWNLLLFWCKEVMPTEFLYTGIDTLWLRDPEYISAWCEDQEQYPVITMSDYIHKGHINTSLTYINHNHPEPSEVWKEFIKLKESPPHGKINFGEQEFVDKVLREKFPDTFHKVVHFFPSNFMGSYKTWFEPKWKRFRQRNDYQKHKLEDFFAFTFHGKPDAKEVVDKKLPGHDNFSVFFEQEPLLPNRDDHHWISELYDTRKGDTVIVVGNGFSKKKYDINALHRKGHTIFGCNWAYKDHHVDILGFRDKGENNKLRLSCMNEFPGTKIHQWYPDQEKFPALNQACLRTWDTLYRFKFPDKDSKQTFLDKDRLFKVTTGNMMIQLACRMGFKRVVLIGMDCCAMPGQRTSNLYRDDSQHFDPNHKEADKRKPEKVNGLYWTSNYLRNFIKQNMRTIKFVRSQGVEVVKLGDYGLLPIPFIEEGALWEGDADAFAAGVRYARSKTEDIYWNMMKEIESTCTDG